VLDLGYLKVKLAPGWIARAELSDTNMDILLVREQAQARITLYYAGLSDSFNALQRLYKNMELHFRSRGLHFDDLSEDFENEMITEIESKPDNLAIQHLYFRLVEDLIVVISLDNFAFNDEDTVRAMLNTFKRTEMPAKGQELELLAFPANVDAWDRIGNIATSHGVSQ